MDLYLNRFYSDNNGTSGILYLDEKPFCYTTERPWLENQRSISCIPEGKYPIRFRPDPTPKTMEYRTKYPFFSFHLELQNVKNRSGIYIHVGNKPENVKGCIAVGHSAGYIGINYVISYRMCFKRLYGILKTDLTKGLPVFITITTRA